MMGATLLMVGCDVAQVKGVSYFTFNSAYSSIMSYGCNGVRTQVCVLVKFSFPRVFEKNLVSYIVFVWKGVTVLFKSKKHPLEST